MAKISYGIPVSLDRSILDHEIAFPIFGWQIPATPIKQLVTLLGGIFVIIWVATSTFVSESGPINIALFAIWGLVVLLYLGGLTRTRELRFMSIPGLLAYIPTRARKVFTRRSSPPAEFAAIVGIDEISEDGLITWSDGTYGQAYLVVGSASYLLFEEDRNSILDRVDAFWRKVPTTCEFIQITTKEPQRIHHQVASLERRNQQLTLRDPDLLELQNEQFDILDQHVGGKFASIHQHLVLKASSTDALRQGHMVLQAEVEGSSLMIKEASYLDRDQTQQMLRAIYRSTAVDTDLTTVADVMSSTGAQER